MTTKKKTFTANRKPFDVQKLPPEIRYQIWELMVVKYEPTYVYNHRRHELAQQLPLSSLGSKNQLGVHRKDDLERSRYKLAVAFTCRQLYSEVTEIYYSKNTFALSSVSHVGVRAATLRNFTAAIGPDKARSIMSIILKTPSYRSFESLSLDLLPSLRKVGIEILGRNGPIFQSTELVQLEQYVERDSSAVLTMNGKPWSIKDNIERMIQSSSYVKEQMDQVRRGTDQNWKPPFRVRLWKDEMPSYYK